ncbi:type IV pilin protein [Geminocystis sp. NIES-3709]|uniref:type IV pilin protein n=1 Tax=Geminocystis sp. NIES-3709 TaxID=1617448 RepID=UPI0005FC98A6|nr:type II secretion system protein [Geminocystis sp. NIES-3709]BAQ65652.1 general secretion pathway protein G [Geminocystis sp. NIES-3709]
MDSKHKDIINLWQKTFFLYFRSDCQEKAFTLLEILIVTVIIGILAAIAYPNLLRQIDKARYTEAILAMDCVADELRSYHFERQVFPPDVNRNNRPSGINCFPISTQNKIPFNSIYDYDSINAPGGRCYIQIVFFGKNQQRDSATNTILFTQGGLYDTYDDDLILSLGTFDVTCQ